MKRGKIIRKVEKIVSEEVSKDFSEYCGDNFDIGPILVKTDYQPFREPHPEQSQVHRSVRGLRRRPEQCAFGVEIRRVHSRPG